MFDARKQIWLIAAAASAGTYLPGTPQPSDMVIGRNVQVSKAMPANSHYEVLAAADPRDAAHMIAGSFIYSERSTTPATIVYSTRDGGSSWSPTLHDDTLANTSDPAPAYGQDGTAFFAVAWLGPPGTSRSSRTMLLFRSKDGGATWAPPTSLPYMDREYVTVDQTGGKYNGNVYVNGNSRGADGVSDFVVYTSSDGGRTFRGPGKRPGFGQFRAEMMGNAVVASDGTLTGVFADEKSLQAIMSTDGGMSLTPAATIDGAFVPGGDRKGAHNNVVGMPLVAIDRGRGPYKDHLYVVWADRRTGSSRIFFASSADKGLTWTKSREIDASTPSDSTDQFLPTVAVNSAGVVGVMWYDRRNHPDNLGWDVRFTASVDGGTTFLPSVQVSERGTTFDATTPWTALRSSVARAKGDTAGLVVTIALNTFMFQGGDTSGLVADASGVFHAVWVDNRTGVPQIWTAPVRVTATVRVIKSEDVSDKLTLDITANTYDHASNSLTAVARLQNTSAQVVAGPFHVRVVSLSSGLGEPTVVAADNGRPGVGAEWIFSAKALTPGAATGTKALHFKLANIQPFQNGDRYRGELLQLKVVVTNEAVTNS
jgi:hypothetical protein